MNDKNIKNDSEKECKENTSDSTCCCYIADPCGCYVDPCGCHVDVCCC